MLMRLACRAIRSGSLSRLASSVLPRSLVTREVRLSSWQGGTPTVQRDWWAQRTKPQWRGLVAKATAGKKQQPAQPAADADDTDLVGDLGESDDFLDELEEFEEEVGQEVSTNNLDWGEKALAVARQLLADQDAFSELELFSLRAIANGKRLDIRLDKMTDLYGSPSLDDIEAFSRAFVSHMEASLGEEAAGEIEVEVSSPGAERMVRIPGELERFAELPMKVEFHSSEDPEKIDTRVFDLVDVDSAAGMSRWRLANVRANRQQGGKGRALNRKQREQVFEVPLASLRRVNLHLDL